jgi:hypothetical protein
MQKAVPMQESAGLISNFFTSTFGVGLQLILCFDCVMSQSVEESEETFGFNGKLFFEAIDVGERKKKAAAQQERVRQVGPLEVPLTEIL